MQSTWRWVNVSPASSVDSSPSIVKLILPLLSWTITARGVACSVSSLTGVESKNDDAQQRIIDHHSRRRRRLHNRQLGEDAGVGGGQIEVLVFSHMFLFLSVPVELVWRSLAGLRVSLRDWSPRSRSGPSTASSKAKVIAARIIA